MAVKLDYLLLNYNMSYELLAALFVRWDIRKFDLA